MALLLVGLAAWSFLNGRFVFAFDHAFVAFLRVKNLPVWTPQAEAPSHPCAPPRRRGPGQKGKVQEVLRRGGCVSVVYLTSGDGFDLAAGSSLSPGALKRLALRRMVEARQGTEALGLTRKDLYFLRFPDQGLYELFTTHHRVPYTRPYTGLSGVVYPGATA